MVMSYCRRNPRKAISKEREKKEEEECVLRTKERDREREKERKRVREASEIGKKENREEVCVKNEREEN